MSKLFVVLAKAALCSVFALSLVPFTVAQAKPKSGKASPEKATAEGPKVTQIDIEGLRKLLKPSGKPLLINLWATWCDPCREEFPDLVKLDAEYKGRVDFITVSLDDLEDIATLVPKFLREVKAEMPAYLLKTPDESAAISMVAKDWSGNLPLTVLFSSAGEPVYTRPGKFKYETLKEELEKVLSPKSALQTLPVPELDRVSAVITLRTIEMLPYANSQYTYDKGVADAEKEMASGQFKTIKYGLTPGSYASPDFEALKKKYSLTISEVGCLVPSGYSEYTLGFNETMRVGFERKFGSRAARKMGISSDSIE